MTVPLPVQQPLPDGTPGHWVNIDNGWSLQPREEPEVSNDEPAWVFSDEVIAKAKGYVRQTRELAPGLFSVVSPNGAYRVATDAGQGGRTVSWATCTCPHGQHNGVGTPRCSHVVAVLMVIRDRLAAEQR